MKTSISLLVSLFLFLFVFTACFKNPEPQPCTYDPCAIKAPAGEIASVQAYLDSMGITGTTQHCSGVFYKIASQGTGKTPEACSAIVAKYKGMLTNGNVFDSGTFQRPLYL